MEYLEELEESLHKGLKIVQKAKQKVGGMGGFREGGGYGNRFSPMGHNPMMPNGYPPMGMPPMGPMGMPPMGGQMGFREDEMMERRGRDSMGRYTRG